jgi:hypothetical protein
MVEPAQVAIKSNGDDEFQTQGVGHVKLVTEKRALLSENFNVEIYAWARQALAANGFSDY